MSLTPGLADAFRAGLTTLPPSIPELRVLILQAAPRDDGRLKCRIWDGQYIYYGVIESHEYNPEIDTNTVYLLTSYRLQFSTRPGSETRNPIVQVLTFREFGRYTNKIPNASELVKFRLDPNAPAKSGRNPTPEATTGAGNGSTSGASTTAASSTSNRHSLDALNDAQKGQASGSRNTPKSKPATRHDPIESVTPFVSKWRIRARASQKSNMIEYHNARNTGKLFNVTFVDESGEIRATAFNETADKFYELIQEGQLYYLDNARVNHANAKFSTTSHEFELMLNNDTKIELCSDKVDAVPEVMYNFIQLSQLTDKPVDTFCDVIAVIKDVEDVQSLTSKTGRPYEKRDLTLVDDSGSRVRCTMWGNEASQFNGAPSDVIALKGVRTGMFNGERNLSTGRTTLTVLNPTVNEAYKLKGWYDASGVNETFSVVSADAADEPERKKLEIKLIKDVISESEGIGQGAEPLFFSVKATVQHIFARTIAYPACTEENCNKKVHQETSGEWFCEKSNVRMSQPKYRYVLSLIIGDVVPSLGLRVSAFDEAGKVIVGKTADEVREEAGGLEDESRVKQVLHPCLDRTFLFRIKASVETYQEEQRMRYQILSAYAADDLQDAKRSLQEMGF